MTETPEFSFKLHKTSGKARRGTITTAHGTIETPVFMPVGTNATVKAVFPEDVHQTGARIILGNTYHLMLRPSAEVIESFGGLHKFMNWPHPILTDSGGFQVMSLAKLRKITEEGVKFRCHISGQAHMLTPERSIQIQHALSSDITMIFDECTPYPATHKKARRSMELSLRWAERSKKTFIERPGYGLFGIVQGSVYEDLRAKSAKELIDLNFHGYAVGGLAVGEGQEVMLNTLSFTLPMLPQDKPRYLMGVGKPDDLVEAVKQGIDMFDCVIPTRSGRKWQAFTKKGTVNLRNARHRMDHRPVEEGCGCRCCTNYSRAYIHHMYKANEIFGMMLLSQHNIWYYQSLMQSMRNAIDHDAFDAFYYQFYQDYLGGDIPSIE